MILKLILNTQNGMDDIWENIKEHNPNKKRKRLIAFYDVTAHMLSNKNLNLVVNEYLSEVENWAFLLLLWHNFILLYRKMLD